MHHYHTCGISFECVLELPGVPRARPHHTVTASIVYGPAPDGLEEATSRGAAYEAAPGRLLLKTPVGRYFVKDGSEIIIEPNSNATEGDIRVFLMGSAFGALLHQRGVLPLHASCVRVGDGCAAFAGLSGAGKSTLAAYLQQRGYMVLTDDVCPVRFLPGVGAVVFPGFPRVKLWAEALRSLALDVSDYQQPRSNLQKYELTTDNTSAEPFVPLRRLYLLREVRDALRDPQGIKEVEGPPRLQALLKNTYRFRYLKGFGTKPDHLRTCASVVKSISVHELWREWNLSKMPEVLEALETHWTDLMQSSECSPQGRAAA